MSADPIFTALARWHAARTAHLAAHRHACLKWPRDLARAEEVANRAAWGARDRALRALYATTPTTLAGLAALAEVYRAEEFAMIEGDEAARGLDTLLRGIAGLAAAREGVETADSAFLARLRRRPARAAA
jgi:hypothetical protein